uniref:Uncharacterized protein n=1 Tax=viral metagenome TaxID=1070528 RepID=A0A6M3XF53_9ZZZZ
MEDIYIKQSPEANFELTVGEYEAQLTLKIMVKKSLVNRIKYRLFCWLFPFRITRWDEME